MDKKAILIFGVGELQKSIINRAKLTSSANTIFQFIKGYQKQKKLSNYGITY